MTNRSGVDPLATARAGFLVIVQDTRGRFASGGVWEPLRHEAWDGADSIAWAARLPNSNGRVGLFGGSYSGNTQWQAALTQPSALSAMAPLLTWADPRDGLYSRGGVLELGLDLPWTLLTGIDDLARRFEGDSTLNARLAAVLDEFDHLPDVGFWGLPATRTEMLERHGVKDFGSLAAAAGGVRVQDPADISGGQYRAGVPALQTGGWYDIFLQGTLDNHRAMVDAGLESSLVVGPWTHENFGHVVGETDFGIRAARDSPAVVPAAGSWSEAQLSWFRRRLDAGTTPRTARDIPPVRVFVMGRNEWRSEPVWPPAEARDTEFFLHPDGLLSRQLPRAGDTPVTYSYDLSHPVPTVGGNTYITAGFPPGPADQREVEARADVLSFTSEVLTEDLEVAGRVIAHVFTAGSAMTSDWVIRLCDVHPDGRSINVCDGVVRVPDAQSLRRHTVDLWSTSMVFLKGHRIRVHITNSSFPRWDRPPCPSGAETYLPQDAQVYTDPQHPSVVVLPVMPAGRQS